MDTRRFLILTFCGCMAFPSQGVTSDLSAALSTAPTARMDPIPNPPRKARLGRAGPTRDAQDGRVGLTPTSGRSAIAAANLASLETSKAEGFFGGVQIFAHSPGSIYEVWTAPLRVTTLTLAPGERVTSMAAGDTRRWQIGETTSGEGEAQRAHVMIKPIERGLETNLVLTTSARVYFVKLRSGSTDTFNAAVAWNIVQDLEPVTPRDIEPASAEQPAMFAGPLDARFTIKAGRPRPAWAPTMVATDGVRTFLSFSKSLAAQEAPVLFVLGAGGDRQLVNYRQQGELWVVDRVFDRAELRTGATRAQVVRITRRGDHR